MTGGMTGGISLYRRALGPAFDSLPAEIRAMHDAPDGGAAHGRCHIERGRGLAARWVGRLFGFPPAGRCVPVTVRFEADGAREIWRRDFAGRKLISIQEPAPRGRTGCLVERFGPCAVELAVPAGPDGLRLEPRRMWLFGVPMPRFLMPGVQAGERVLCGRFRFDVCIALPLLGMLVRYRGYLAPVGRNWPGGGHDGG